MSEWLALPTADHKVLGMNPAKGRIHLMPVWCFVALRKHTYSNIVRILPPKNENFQMKISGSFHISAQNINCERLLELPQ